MVKVCDDNAVKTLCEWIDMYEAIGIKNIVLHCGKLLYVHLSRQEKIDKNVENLKLIAQYVKDKDITICLENLGSFSIEETDLIDKSADDLLYIIDAVGSDRFVSVLIRITLIWQKKDIMSSY